MDQDRWLVRICQLCGEANNHRRGFVCEMCAGRLGDPIEVMPVPVVDADSPGLVSARHGATARLAALRAQPRAGTHRHRVLRYIEECRAIGATRDEIAHGLRVSPNTVRPRVRELIDGGHVAVSEFRRATPLGEPAEVIIATRYLTPRGASLQGDPRARRSVGVHHGR